MERGIMRTFTVIALAQGCSAGADVEGGAGVDVDVAAADRYGGGGTRYGAEGSGCEK